MEWKAFVHVYCTNLAYLGIIESKDWAIHPTIERRRPILNNHQSIRQLTIAIYTVNRHAKTAPNNKELYELKKKALDKLISSGDATKIGLHFVENPKFSKQHSTTLVSCCDFLFHMIPEKEDFKSLPHLGQQDQASRNPQERMSLRVAKELLANFIGVPPKTSPKKVSKIQKRKVHNMDNTNNFRSSYLDGR